MLARLRCFGAKRVGSSDLTGGRTTISTLVLLGCLLLVVLPGCSSDFARKEGLGVVPGNEFRAEVKINNFLNDLGDERFDDACEKVSPILKRRVTDYAGTCEEGMRGLLETGIGGLNVTVLGSEKVNGRLRDGDLVVRTDEVYFVMNGDLIAGVSPEDPLDDE